MTAYQLTLARTGFCRLCGVVRLSVVNTNGICDGCADDQSRALIEARRRQPYGVPRTVCAVCGGGPVTHRGRCRPCNIEDARRAYDRRKAGARCG